MRKYLILISVLVLHDCRTTNAELKYSVSDDVRTALEAGTCTHKTTIPKVLGESYPTGEIINRKIDEFMVKIEEEYKPVKHIKKHLEECLSRKYSLIWSARYVKKRHDQQILSFRFSTRFYTEGYIHPQYEEHGLTFDASTGLPLKLVDIVIGGKQKDFMRIFQGYFEKKKMFRDEAGRMFKFHELSKFYLTTEKIVIFLDGHEVVPDVDGIETVAIPLRDLKDLLVAKYGL